MKKNMFKKATVVLAIVTAALTVGCNSASENAVFSDPSGIISVSEAETMPESDGNTDASVTKAEEKASVKTLDVSVPKAEVKSASPKETKETKAEPKETKAETKETETKTQVKSAPKTEGKEVKAEIITAAPAMTAPVLQEVPETVTEELPYVPSAPEETSFESENEADSDYSDSDNSNSEQHTHTWITETIHHDAETHEETVTETVHHDAVTESEYVPVIVCECGGRFDDGKEFDKHECNTCQWSCLDWEKRTVEVSPAWDEEVTETVTVTDHGAWDEVITICSGCGQCKE